MDVAPGEKVEKELMAFRQTEGERRIEEAWMKSERGYDERRRRENREGWCEYHQYVSNKIQTTSGCTSAPGSPRITFRD